MGQEKQSSWPLPPRLQEELGHPPQGTLRAAPGHSSPSLTATLSGTKRVQRPDVTRQRSLAPQLGTRPRAAGREPRAAALTAGPRSPGPSLNSRIHWSLSPWEKLSNDLANEDTGGTGPGPRPAPPASPQLVHPEGHGGSYPVPSPRSPDPAVPSAGQRSNGGRQNDTSTPGFPEPVKATELGKRVFAGVIKVRISRRDCPELGRALNSMMAPSEESREKAHGRPGRAGHTGVTPRVAGSRGSRERPAADFPSAPRRTAVPAPWSRTPGLWDCA